MGILDGFPPYALYLFEDSYEVGSTSLIDWNGSEAEEFDFSHEHVVFWPERPADSNKGKKLKSKSYPAKVLCFNGTIFFYYSRNFVPCYLPCLFFNA